MTRSTAELEWFPPDRLSDVSLGLVSACNSSFLRSDKKLSRSFYPKFLQQILTVSKVKNFCRFNGSPSSWYTKGAPFAEGGQNLLVGGAGVFSTNGTRTKQPAKGEQFENEGRRQRVPPKVTATLVSAQAGESQCCLNSSRPEGTALYNLCDRTPLKSACVGFCRVDYATRRARRVKYVGRNCALCLLLYFVGIGSPGETDGAPCSVYIPGSNFNSGVRFAERGGERTPSLVPLPVEKDSEFTRSLHNRQTHTIHSTLAPFSSRPRFSATFPSRSLGVKETPTNTYSPTVPLQTSVFANRPPSVSTRSFILDSVGPGGSASRLASATPLPDRKTGHLENTLLWNLKTDTDGWFAIEDLKVDRINLGAIVKQGHQVSIPLRISAAERVKIYLRSTIEYDKVMATLGDAVGILQAQKANLAEQSKTDILGKIEAYGKRSDADAHSEGDAAEHIGTSDSKTQLSSKPSSGRPPGGEKAEKEGSRPVREKETSEVNKQAAAEKMSLCDSSLRNHPGGPPFQDNGDPLRLAEDNGCNYLDEGKIAKLRSALIDEEEKRPTTRPKRRQDLAARVTGIQRTIGAPDSSIATHRSRGASSAQASLRRQPSLASEPLPSGRHFFSTQDTSHTRMYTLGSSTRERRTPFTVTDSPDAFQDMSTIFTARSGHAFERLSPLWDGWEDSVERMVAETKSLDWSTSDRMLQAVRLQVGAALGSDLAGSRAADTDMITTRSTAGTPRANERRSDTRGRRLRLSSDDVTRQSHTRASGKTPPIQILNYYMGTLAADGGSRRPDQLGPHPRPVDQKHLHQKENSDTTLIDKGTAEPTGLHTSNPSYAGGSEEAHQGPPVAAQRKAYDAKQASQAFERNASSDRGDDDESKEKAEPPLLKVVHRPVDDLSHRHHMVVINIDALGRRLDATSGRPLFYNDRVIVGWRCSNSELHAIMATNVVKESLLGRNTIPEAPEQKPDTPRTAPPVLCSSPDSHGKTVCGHVPPHLGLKTRGVKHQLKRTSAAHHLTKTRQRKWTADETEKDFEQASFGWPHSPPVMPRRRLQVLSHMVDRFAAHGIDSVTSLFRRRPPTMSSQVEKFGSQTETTAEVPGGTRIFRTKTDAQSKSENNPSDLRGHASAAEDLFTVTVPSSPELGTEQEIVHHTDSDSGLRFTKTSSEPEYKRIKATAHEGDHGASSVRGHQSNSQKRERLTSRTLLDVDELCGLDLIKLSLHRPEKPASRTTEKRQPSHDDLHALKAFIDQFASHDYVDDILFIAPDAPIRTAAASSYRARESEIGRGRPQSTVQEIFSTTDSRRERLLSEDTGSNLVLAEQVDALSCSTDVLQFSKEYVCEGLKSSLPKSAPDPTAHLAARALHATDSSEEICNSVVPNDPLFAVQWALGSSKRQRGVDSNACFAKARDEMFRHSTDTPTHADLATTPTSRVPQQVATDSQLAKIRHLCETIGSRSLQGNEAATSSQRTSQEDEVPAFHQGVTNANALRQLESTSQPATTVSDIQSTPYPLDGKNLYKMAQKREGSGGDLVAEGNVDSSINMLQAWGLKLKEDQQKKLFTVPVAVIDTGVNYIHPDLADSMWLNEKELNGIPGYDDDQNGYVDDIYGWNFLHDNNNPMDDNGHGSHVAGIIGAQRNNHKGVCGISSHARIIALKILDENGEGDVSHAIPAIRYALDNGARIITNSWGGITGPGTHILGVLLREAVSDASSSVFVIASGNDGRDITKEPYYPASFLRDWTITVAAHTPDGVLPRWSNYGQHSVHLTAPGENITSTWLGNGYRLSSGTSMAAPMVSGVAAEILAYSPHLQPQQVVDALIQSSTPDTRQKNSSLTGARLNAFRAIILSQMHFFSLSQSELHVGDITNSVGTVTVRLDTGVLPLGVYHGSVEVIYVRRIGSKHSSMLTSVFKRRLIQLVQISLPVTMKVV